MNRNQPLVRRMSGVFTALGSPLLEPLEVRALLTAVSWTGNAGDNLWSTPGNWSSNAVPGSADDVTIDVASDPQVRFTAAAGSRTINSLLSRENLSFEGGSLKILTTGRLEGAIGAAMAGGTLEGGNWSYQGGASFNFFPSGGVLKDVAVNADILLGGAAANIVLQGATTFTSLRLQAENTVAYMAAGYTIASPVIAEGAATGTRYLGLAYGGAGTVTIAPTGSVILASSARGNLSIQNSAAATLVNDGLISAESSGQTLEILTTAFTNDAGATAQALGGTLRLASGFYTNAGTFKVASGASVKLDGTFFAAGGWGTLLNTGGGAFKIVGLVNNFANTFTTDATTGSLSMEGGTLSGGTLRTLDGTSLLLTTQSGLVKDLTVDGDIRTSYADAYATIAGTTTFKTLRLVDGFSKVFLSYDLVITGTISVEGDSVGTRTIYVNAGASVPVIGPTGVIRVDGGAASGLNIDGELMNYGLVSGENTAFPLSIRAKFTNAAGGTVRAAPGLVQFSGGTNAAGPLLTLGTLQVANGGTLTIGGPSWDTRFGVGTLINDGTGVIAVGTQVNNANNTITLNDTTGSLTFIGGTILSGSVVCQGSTNVPVTGALGLTNVTITGEVILAATNSRLTLNGTASTFTIARLIGSGSTLQLPAGASLNSVVSVEGPATGMRFVAVAAFGVQGINTFGPSAVVRLAPGCGGSLTFSTTSPSAQLINNGLISAEAEGQTISILVPAFGSQNTVLTNQSTGIIRALAGTVKLGALSYTNQGTFRVGGPGTLQIAGTFNAVGGVGTLINDGTGVMSVTGTVINTAKTINLNATTGSLTMAGGTIKRGSINCSGGAGILTTAAGGTLDSVTVAGELLLSSIGANLTVAGTTTFTAARLTGNSVALYVAANATIDSLVSAEGAGSGTRYVLLASDGAGTVTFGPNAIIRLAPGTGGGLNIQNNNSATLVNNGLIQGQATGRSLTILTTSFTNNGTVDAAGSSVQLNSITTTNFAGNALTGGIWKASSGGTLSGGVSSNIKTLNATVMLDGSVAGWNALAKLETIATGGVLQITGGATLALTPAIGTFTNNGSLTLGVGSLLAITGNYVQTASGTLQSQIAGTSPSSYGRLTATGTGQLDGSLVLTAVNGYVPTRGDTQDVVVTGGACQGTFSSTTVPPPANADWKTTVVYTGTGVRLLTTSLIDLNNDGQLDLEDFFDFFNKWDMSDSSLDLNGDGSVDLGDFFLFFNLFDQG